MVVAELIAESQGDKGEMARMIRKLAEAHYLNGDSEKATELKKWAELVRQEIQGDRFRELPDEDLSYAMMSYHAIW